MYPLLWELVLLLRSVTPEIGCLPYSSDFQVIDYEIPASHLEFEVVAWPPTLPTDEYVVKPEVGLRVVKGSMGLRGRRGTDWIRKEPVGYGEFVADTQLPRGKFLAVPVGRPDTGPLEATHWMCPCGGFKVGLAIPGTMDRYVTACGLLIALFC